ncbi:MAG: hypothetical protein EPO68_16555 [Planctomycetota bacterium]|nr:MAG: hypothetical protein EPO68_16555 [Planctomycetota bacterium]
MSTESQDSASKRSYRRRSDDERLAELQHKLEQAQQRLKHREERKELAKHVPNPATLKLPVIIKKLREFAAYAHINGRLDYYNSTIAFVAMMDRLYHEDMHDPNGEEATAEEGFDA